MVGNGPHHCSPCKYASVARPALYTKGNLQGVWAMGPPTMCHHRLPIHIEQDQGIRHADLLDPMPSISAPVGGDAEYLVREDDLLVHPPQVFNL